MREPTLKMMRSSFDESRANSRRVSGNGFVRNANNSDSRDFSSMHEFEHIKPNKYLISSASIPVTRLEALAWLEEST